MNFYKPKLSSLKVMPLSKIICLVLLLSGSFSSLTGQAQEGPDARLIQASLERTSLSEGEILVDYLYDYRAAVNPLRIEYQYIQKHDADKMSLPLSSFLDHVDLHLDDHVELTSVGYDYVDVPFNLTKGQRLDAQEVVYELKSGDQLIISYDAKVSNREVIGQELLTVNGKSVEAYIVRAELDLTKILNSGNVLSTERELLFDWYVEGVGLVKRSREPFTRQKSKSSDVAVVTIYN